MKIINVKNTKEKKYNDEILRIKNVERAVQSILFS